MLLLVASSDADSLARGQCRLLEKSSSSALMSGQSSGCGVEGGVTSLSATVGSGTSSVIGLSGGIGGASSGASDALASGSSSGESHSEVPKGDMWVALSVSGSSTAPASSGATWRSRIRSPDLWNLASSGTSNIGSVLADVISVIGSYDIVLGSVDAYHLICPTIVTHLQRVTSSPTSFVLVG